MSETFHRAGARSPEYALLGFLYEQPMHGYTLHRQLVRELGHVWHVSQSQSYAILKRLETQGYVTATTLEQEKRPPRLLLMITAAGRSRFEAWMRTPTGTSVHLIRLEFITRLYFAQKDFPELIPVMFDEESASIDLALARLKKAADAIPAEQPFNRLSVDLRLSQLSSIRDWLLECRKAFEINS